MGARDRGDGADYRIASFHFALPSKAGYCSAGALVLLDACAKPERLQQFPHVCSLCSASIGPCATHCSGEIVRESDQEHWLTYAELGQLLGISSAAARMHAKRRGWPRRSPNMIGDRARVLVPADATVQPRSALFDERASHVITRDQGEPNELDQANVRLIEQAITALSEALAAERVRVTRAEQRIDELLTDLTDARAAERISADSAAALRHELGLLRARPWWRRWLFR